MNPAKPYQLATAVLDALVAGWPVEAAPLPDRQYVCDGAAPAIDCEQVVVAVESLFPHTGNLLPLTDPINCVFVSGAQLSVWISRCVPVPDDNGTAPSALAIEEAAVPVLADPTLATDAILDAGVVSPKGLIILGVSYPGPEGGFSTSKLTLRADLTGFTVEAS